MAIVTFPPISFQSVNSNITKNTVAILILFTKQIKCPLKTEIMKKKILEATLPLLNIFRIDLLSDKRCLNACLYPLQKNRRPLFMKRQEDKIVRYAFFASCCLHAFPII